MDFGALYAQDHSYAQVASSRSCRFPQEDESGCVFVCNDGVPQGVDECGLRQEALAWCFHVHADSFCMAMQRRLHQSMYLFQIYVSLKFWISGFAGVIFFGYTVQFEMM